MNLVETFQMAVQNILGSKMRTFLTMLGIIIAWATGCRATSRTALPTWAPTP